MPRLVACLRCGRANRYSTCRACKRRDAYQQQAWRKLAGEVKRRDGVCLVCGSTERLTAHHLEPRREGGADSARNCVSLCGWCHSRYEGDKRAGRDTAMVRTVERLGFWLAPTSIAPRRCAKIGTTADFNPLRS